MLVYKSGKKTLIFVTKAFHHEESFSIEFPRGDLRDSSLNKIFEIKIGEDQWSFIRSLEKKYRKDNFLCTKSLIKK